VKIKLQKIFIVNLIIFFLFSGSFYYSVCCEKEECCKTECCKTEFCEENSVLVDSDFDLTLDNTDCCEYSQGYVKEIKSTAPFNLILSISNHPSNINYFNSNNSTSKHFLPLSALNHLREGNSISILRI